MQETYSFYSSGHPGEGPWRWAFTDALIRPLMICLLPLMVGALLAVLQGFPALSFLVIGFPLAVLLAALWTTYQLQATIAEIHVRPGEAAIRTTWACLRGNTTLTWQPILELRRTPSTLTMALGDAAYEVETEAWPEAETLVRTLQAARDVFTLS